MLGRLAAPAVVRTGIGAVGVVTLIVAGGFFVDGAFVAWMWPYPVTHLTNVFIAGVLAAFAVPMLWISWTGEVAALAGAGLTATIAFGGIALMLLAAPADAQRPGHVVATGFLAILAAIAVLLTVRRPFVDPRPTPSWTRIAFIAIVVVLLAAGGLALLAVPNILPWKIDGLNAQLVGWVFIADAAYFAYGAVRPRWPNAVGQLLAFAAYDVVLLWPFTDHLVTRVVPEQRLSLVLYLAVLVASLAMGIVAVIQVARHGRLDRGSAVSNG